MLESIENATGLEAENRRQSVARRAYEKWLARGRSGRTAEQDWLEAEAEIDAESMIAEEPRHICRTQMPADDVLI